MADKEQTQRVRTQVRWLTRTLAGARDGEVVRERILAELDDLPRGDVHGGIRRRLHRELDRAHARAHAHVVVALAGARDERLLSGLVEFLLHLPWKERSRRTLSDLLLAATRRVESRAHLADEAETPAAREHELHEVRKKGKAARYAVEAATKFADAVQDDPGAECDDTAPDEAPIRADPKEALAAWVDLQELLGDHQDAVVARAELRRIAAAAARRGGGHLQLRRAHRSRDPAPGRQRPRGGRAGPGSRRPGRDRRGAGRGTDRRGAGRRGAGRRGVGR